MTALEMRRREGIRAYKMRELHKQNAKDPPLAI
jgi:hypothetical protein